MELYSIIRDVFVWRKHTTISERVFVLFCFVAAESFNLVSTLVVEAGISLKKVFNQFLHALTHDMLCVMQRKILCLHYMLVKCWDFLNIISIESL